MLIEFSVGNFKSIKDIETLSMNASNLQPKYPHLEINNVFKINKGLKFLKSKAIYGANASGKSNMYKALEAFISIVGKSVSQENILLRKITSFKLSELTEDEPTYFQIQFLIDDTIYRYGFVANEEKIFSEWLFKKVERETVLFTRENEDFEFNKTQFSEGAIIDDIIKGTDNVKIDRTYLYLTFIAKVLYGKTSSELVNFLSQKIVLVSGLDNDKNRKNAEDFIEEEGNKRVLSELVKAADMGIDDVDYIDMNTINDKNEVKKNEKDIYVYAIKKMYDANNKESGISVMNFNKEESKGTQKMFELAPYIIDCMNNGGVLFIDEFDSRFHSLLTKKIVELFNSKSNGKGQLIFITHDTNILSSKLLRRDQISFANRDKCGASHFYSLAEFKGVRSDSSYENDYIHGKFGAIPSLKDFEEFFIKEDGKEN